MAKTLRSIYQLKITLKGSKPPIWRRLLVPDTIKLDVFNDAVQICMGWTNSHLHEFFAEGKRYGEPAPDFDFSEVLDEKKYRLNQLLKKEKSSLLYTYDFGDNWEHSITLETILPYGPAQLLPCCIKAVGACPPEDVGGIYGYYGFLEAWNDPKHPEHDNYREWIGDEYDPNHYDIEEVNELLLEYCR